MSMPATMYHSAETVRQFPDDGNRYETVFGELLVTPSPRKAHQEVLGEFSFQLQAYLKNAGIRGLLCSPADISWGPDTLVQPDLFVADAEEMRGTDWSDIRTPHLVVEILSPSSVHADRFTKRRLYQEQEVGTYWIVDIDERQVEVWTPAARFPMVERERLTWRHPAATTDCAIELKELFSL
jgi:Uma2 family endonuclease